MCMQSMSLWAEATWYRLGGSNAATEEVCADAPAEPAVPIKRVEAVETADEKVLVTASSPR
ncbi:MAG: hypothetical protein QOC98_2410 [Frankiaceae bacterium]|nr:hypothetical protein [Frankiaceae bacterium]